MTINEAVKALRDANEAMAIAKANRDEARDVLRRCEQAFDDAHSVRHEAERGLLSAISGDRWVSTYS